MIDHTTDRSYAYIQDVRNSVYQILGDDSVWEGGRLVYPVAKSYQYDSFGNIIAETGTLENPFAYTGREWEPDLGLYYYRARWYDPSTGRFISEDPISFTAGDPNIFRYVFNNPVNWIDPWGLYVNVIYVNPEDQPFGHSAIEINGSFYDVSKWGEEVLVHRYTPEEFAGRYGARGYVSTPITVPREDLTQEYLDHFTQSGDGSWDYGLLNNNCQIFVNEAVMAGEGSGSCKEGTSRWERNIPRWCLPH